LGRKADGAKALFAFLFFAKKESPLQKNAEGFSDAIWGFIFFVQELPTTSRIG
jgi:hypothetical protein